MVEKNNRSHQPVWLAAAIHVVIPVTLTVVLFIGSVFFVILPSYKGHLLEAKKEVIKELGNTVWELLRHYEARVSSGELTVAESQSRALERIRALRYGPEAKDYFWINDMQARMVMHPYRMDLEGVDMSDMVDSTGKHYVLDFVKMAQEHGYGFVDYYWQWKDDPNLIAPKLSYVRGFEPWGWVVGTGIYLEDVQVQIDEVTQKLNAVFLVILFIIVVISAYIIVQGGCVEKKQQAAERELSSLKDSLEIEVQKKTAELLETQQQLIKSAQLAAMGQLGATVAHEFRNQLGVMKNAAYYIRKKLGDSPDEKVKKHIRILEEEIIRTDEIIHDILTFARSKPPMIHTIKINDLIAIVQRKVDAYRKKSIVFDVSLDDDVLEMCADEIQIVQILVNLVRNAIEAVEENGSVSLSVGAHDGHVQFCIKDDGMGMTDEVKERLFEPLYTTKARGTGLGLSTVKMLVERHGGSIHIESTKGEGTSICVLIPKVCQV